jgi:hypothetical protein
MPNLRLSRLSGPLSPHRVIAQPHRDTDSSPRSETDGEQGAESNDPCDYRDEVEASVAHNADNQSERHHARDGFHDPVKKSGVCPAGHLWSLG